MGMKKKNRGGLYTKGEQVVSHRRQDADEHGARRRAWCCAPRGRATSGAIWCS